jgi:hypothetical protein
LQQIFDVVQRLDGGGGVVDSWGQRLDSDIHQETEGILGVLLKRAFPLQFYGLADSCLEEQEMAARHGQQGVPFEKGIPTA